VEVRFTHEARAEFNAMPPDEKASMFRVVRLLKEHDERLGYPHTSHVRGADRLRELRPNAGHSAWRAFYRRIGDRWWVGAFSAHDYAGAARRAEARLDRVEKGVDR